MHIEWRRKKQSKSYVCRCRQIGKEYINTTQPYMHGLYAAYLIERKKRERENNIYKIPIKKKFFPNY